jgi:hypothetical protein
MSPIAKQSIPMHMRDHVKFTSPLKKSIIPIIAGMKIMESKIGYDVASTFSNGVTSGSGEYAMYMLGMAMATEIKIAPEIIFFVTAFLTGFR